MGPLRRRGLAEERDGGIDSRRGDALRRVGGRRRTPALHLKEGLAIA